ncbi:FecR domain-containing protein [Sphingobacterium sp. DN00404]|uniref:FecR domain-containing protein n=1 Tax=Sphingobacterium micropteri TaxID=2763501 RepID=A0ABR7YJV1_9SPHI|nr:FecR family protein [Sphingobacterium micropteri]MBD1431539.1 FecR domain-containing protein [Sphingobacterium micropteri]
MKAAKRTSSDPKAEKTTREVTALDSQAELLLEQRLYKRVLNSYSNHLEKRKRRTRMWRSAAIWIGTVMLTGGGIWGTISFHNKGASEKPVVQVFSSMNSSKRICLADSTVVVLRPHSTLQISADYDRIERNVMLEGNAFFEVKKDKEKPFIVHSKHLETTVLGTRFSVNSPIDDGDHSVFLEEGKVRIQIDGEQHLLAPNERIVYHAAIKKREITKLSDVNIDMQTGSLTLDGVDFATLRLCLADYYGISLESLSTKASRVRYKVTLKPQMSVTDIAALISTISARRTTINQQTITVK